MKTSTVTRQTMPPSMIQKILTLCLLFVSAVSIATAQTNKVTAPKKEDPQPTVIDPGAPGKAPSDAIVLFDGKNLQAWKPSTWKIVDGALEAGHESLETQEAFGVASCMSSSASRRRRLTIS